MKLGTSSGRRGSVEEKIDRPLAVASASSPRRPLLMPHLSLAARVATPRPVDKDDLTEAVAAWLPAWGLPAAPAAGMKDLRGQGIRVAKFTDEETSRFFFPRRTLLFQQRMVKELSILLRKRGGKIISVPLTIEDYARWQQNQGEPDTADLRFRFATRPPEF